MALRRNGGADHRSLTPRRSMTRRRSRAVRLLLMVPLLLAIAAAVVLTVWGTRWTVPQGASTGAGYTLVATWEGRDIPSGTLERPIGIAVSPSGDVYVTDALQRVVRFSPDGAFQAEWGRPGEGPGEFSNAVGVAVGRDGVVYVSDYHRDRIQTFSPTGEVLGEFGRSGSGPGEFSAPADLALDDDGFLYVADFYNHRVQKLAADGTFQTVIGHAGRVGPGALHYPTGVTIAAAGELLVADAYNYQLQWFDREGQPRDRVGYHLFWFWPRPATSPAGFFVPTDAAEGPAGIIHVADSGNHRVVMLSASGERLGQWELPDPNPDIYSPEQVAVSRDGKTVFATDLGRNRILVLEVGLE